MESFKIVSRGRGAGTGLLEDAAGGGDVAGDGGEHHQHRRQVLCGAVTASASDRRRKKMWPAANARQPRVEIKIPIEKAPSEWQRRPGSQRDTMRQACEKRRK